MASSVLSSDKINQLDIRHIYSMVSTARRSSTFTAGIVRLHQSGSFRPTESSFRDFQYFISCGSPLPVCMFQIGSTLLPIRFSHSYAVSSIFLLY